uniref:Uncharacterized protein n=1 Tax=Arundo donax TaxID=35708 RepID=A0A0A8YBJ5_ARUDO
MCSCSELPAAHLTWTRRNPHIFRSGSHTSQGSSPPFV